MIARLPSALVASLGFAFSLLATSTACRSPARLPTWGSVGSGSTDKPPVSTQSLPAALRPDSPALTLRRESDPPHAQRASQVLSPTPAQAPPPEQAPSQTALQAIPHTESNLGRFSPQAVESETLADHGATGLLVPSMSAARLAQPAATPVSPEGTPHSAAIPATGSLNAFTTSAAAARSERVQTNTAVKLSIANVRPGHGPLKVALFSDQDSFPNPVAASQTFILDAAQPIVEFEVSVNGRFAVAVYQDINSDGELNRNRWGVPVEPFAFSNNAMGHRGPPEYAAAAIDVPIPGGARPTASIYLP